METVIRIRTGIVTTEMPIPGDDNVDAGDGDSDQSGNSNSSNTRVHDKKP